jgi:hypothetical protein
MRTYLLDQFCSVSSRPLIDRGALNWLDACTGERGSFASATRGLPRAAFRARLKPAA